MSNNLKPIIIFGPPRSGTTWVGKILSSDGFTKYIHEPDNEKITGLAYLYKDNLERFPYLRENEENNRFKKIFENSINDKYITSKSPLNKMFYLLLNSNKEKIEEQLKSDGLNNVKVGELNKFFIETINKLYGGLKLRQYRIIIKSVHACLAIPYLLKNFDFIPLIVLRHPGSVAASYLKLSMPDASRNLLQNQNLLSDHLEPFLDQIGSLRSKMEQIGLQIGIFHFVFKKFIDDYNLKYTKHEDLCIDTVDKFANLYERFNLAWSENVAEKIENLNRVGEGFDTKRISSSTINSWKNSLSKNDIDEVKRGYQIFKRGLLS